VRCYKVAAKDRGLSAVNIRRAKQLEAEGRGACLELLPGSGAVVSAHQHFLMEAKREETSCVRLLLRAVARLL
jgi:hypothetical protein